MDFTQILLIADVFLGSSQNRDITHFRRQGCTDASATSSVTMVVIDTLNEKDVNNSLEQFNDCSR